MMKSMTAFGRARREISGKDITAEIRSVNGRYFDCSVKITRAYSFLEEKIKAFLSENGIARGKVEVYVGIDLLEQQGVQIGIDEAYAHSYIAALERLRDEFALPDDISVSRVASNRDIFIIQKPNDDLERDWADVKAVLAEALEGFIAARCREGERLTADISAKLESIRAMTETVRELSTSDIDAYGAKLETRIKNYLGEKAIVIDESRILTEVAIYCDRASVDEELVRLGCHLAQFEDIAASPEPAGRKLDFLLQEINRETNTIGSKVNNAQIARVVVDMKSELEKIREQIQNIE